MSSTVPITILFVDDDEANRYANSRLLRMAGFAVEEAGTGAQALAALERRPDIAVVDVHLPDMDGFSLCKAIKSHPETGDTPVLLMSAMFTSTADQVQGLEGGADGYLTQPFELPVLRATIMALLRVRQAEEKARKLSREWQTTFDSISDGIWILDDSGQVVRCNRAMEQLWNLPSGEGQGWSFRDLISRTADEAEESGQASAASSLRGYLKRKYSEDEEPELELSGKWFRVTTHALPDKIDAAGGRVQVWSDITLRKRAELEKSQLLLLEQEARKQAEDANRMKDEFLATLSHELRTPLMAIIGWVGLLSEQSVTSSELEQGLEIIDRNARAQSQIINDLLDVSRVIAGKLQISIRPMDLRDVITASVNSISPSATAKGVTIIHDQEQFCCPLEGDPDRLQQVLWNLLSNALKFTPRGGTIEVCCSRENDECVVEVRDTGSGISPEFLPHVFDRFRQQDSSSTRQHGGLGLGLAIVRLLTELHNGRVEAHSEGKDKGTSFRLYFPIAQPSGAVQPREPELIASGEPLAGMKIQVVDDQKETRELLTVIFSRRGATVKDSATARDALDVLREWRPDLLVSDLGMPEEDGFWLIQQVRKLDGQQGGETPALALSAYADAAHRQRALEAGFQEFAAKPLTGEELVRLASQLPKSGVA